MKNCLLILALISALPFSLFAQSTSTTAPPDTFQLGKRKARVPAPDGYTDITAQYTRITGRMKATEDPGHDFLALHVPAPFITKLKVSEDIDLPVYTKVTVNKTVKAVDVGPDVFAAVVATIEKNFGTYIDPDGTLMKNVEKSSSKGLTELFASDTKVNINATKNLGFIQKSNKVFSGMMLIGFEAHGRKMTILATFSLLHINHRMFNVSAYRMSPDNNSIRELADFTKKWTASIIAANK